MQGFVPPTCWQQWTPSTADILNLDFPMIIMASFHFAEWVWGVFGHWRGFLSAVKRVCSKSPKSGSLNGIQPSAMSEIRPLLFLFRQVKNICCQRGQSAVSLVLSGSVSWLRVRSGLTIENNTKGPVPCWVCFRWEHCWTRNDLKCSVSVLAW